jgi:Trk-type K+ transport system membrane component
MISHSTIVLILIIGLLVSGLFGTVTLSNILAVCAMKFKKEAKLLREEGQLPKADSKASKAKICKIAGIAFTVCSILLLAALIYYLYRTIGHDIYELFFQ